MDDFDRQVQERMQATQAQERQRERERAEAAQKEKDRRFEQERILANSAGIVFDNMAERLRLKGVHARVERGYEWTSFVELQVLVGGGSARDLRAYVNDERDTVRLRGLTNAPSDLEFEREDRQSLERVVQEWVLSLLP